MNRLSNYLPPILFKWPSKIFSDKFMQSVAQLQKLIYISSGYELVCRNIAISTAKDSTWFTIKD